MNIAVHITYFDNKNISNQTGILEKNKIEYLKKIINNYKKFNHKVDIFIHTNSKINLRKKILDKSIKILEHLLKKENPRFLTWKCRKLITKQINKYDAYIYSEDDINFSKKNFLYWLKYKDLCLKSNYNLGFFRFEIRKADSKEYLSDIITSLNKFTKINNQKYIVNDVNPNCSFWIMDNRELKEFIKTKFWKFQWNGKNYKAFYDIEIMSAIGWHGKNMNRYKATIVPLINNFPHKNSFVHHLPNNYANKVGYKMLKKSNLLSKNQVEFIQESSCMEFCRWFYYQLRIFNKIKKKIFFWRRERDSNP